MQSRGPAKFSVGLRNQAAKNFRSPTEIYLVWAYRLLQIVIAEIIDHLSAFVKSDDVEPTGILRVRVIQGNNGHFATISICGAGITMQVRSLNPPRHTSELSP